MSYDSTGQPNQQYYGQPHPEFRQYWLEDGQFGQEDSSEELHRAPIQVQNQPPTVPPNSDWNAQFYIDQHSSMASHESTNLYSGASHPVAHQMSPHPPSFPSYYAESSTYAPPYLPQHHPSHPPDRSMQTQDYAPLPSQDNYPPAQQYIAHATNEAVAPTGPGAHLHQWQIEGLVPQDVQSRHLGQEDLPESSTSGASTSTAVVSSRETSPDATLPASSEVRLHPFQLSFVC